MRESRLPRPRHRWQRFGASSETHIVSRHGREARPRRSIYKHFDGPPRRRGYQHHRDLSGCARSPLSCLRFVGWVLVFSLESLLEPRPALPSRLNFIEQLARTIIIHCGGRPCSARFVGLVSALDFTRLRVFHSHLHLAFSLPQDGLVTGLVTAVGTTVNPYIEYYADNLPERRLGVFGIWLVLCGFALQSFQYWVAILDIPVT